MSKLRLKDAPSRTRDLDNPPPLSRALRSRLNMTEVQEYLALFGSKGMLDELLAEIANDKV